jgi:lipopolysaccharide biosynthesis glycosyltransferase
MSIKKIIFQINVPNYGRTDKLTTYTFMSEMYKISEHNARQYAKKFGADYYKIDNENDFKPAAGKHLDYQKLKAYDFVDYDRIIYFDSDYIIKDSAPNLFDICGDHFSACIDPGKAVSRLSEELGMPTNRYFNAGFMYLTKDVLDRTRFKIDEYLLKEWEYQGQGLLNKLFFDFDIDFKKLNSNDWNPVNRTFGTYADHYAGAKKRNWGKVNY